MSPAIELLRKCNELHPQAYYTHKRSMCKNTTAALEEMAWSQL
jgi:hypothetical protein